MRKIGIAAVLVIIMMGVIFPSVISSAASCGETVSQDTAAALKAVDYENSEEIARLLAPSWYSSADKTNKRLEIAKRDNKKFTEVTEEEAIKELNRDNVKVTSLDEAFAEVQGEIEQIIRRVVDGTADAQDKGAAYFTEKILQNKEKLLLGISYLERLYDFQMGDQNIKDILIYAPSSYGRQVNALDWLIKIGSAGGDTLKISNSPNVFGWQKLFSTVTTSMTLDAFLEENRKKWMPDTSLDEWFLQAGSAFIVEKSSTWDETAHTGLYSRFYSDQVLRTHILPLLTVSEDSVYVIANSATITYGIVDCYVDRNLKAKDPSLYEERRMQFRRQLENSAEQQREFIDLWYRLTLPERRGQLSSNRIVLDSLRIYTDTTTSAQTEWSAKFGKEASRGVREFFAPLNLYDVFMFSDGMADGTGVRYYLSKALTERGLATYAHELTHLLLSPVMLNQFGARDGMQAEVYTRGMFEPYELNDPPVFNLNLIYNRQDSTERLHNALPDRFQEEADLQTYMSGLLDVVYTLDYAEADVLFSKTPEEKKKWFHKLEQVEDTKTRSNQGDAGSKHNLDSVRELTLDEAKELNTIDDLIRDSIIVSRYEVNGMQTTGTMASNGYYVVPLFSANYAGVQNENGVSGDVMIRRQAFELLAEYGYYGGMVPYISNQYKADAKSDQTLLSDTYILNKIFGGTYGTMADFKRAMFQKRIEKTGKLKPITIFWENETIVIRDFETLKRLMQEAVESDLKNVYLTSGGFNNIRAQETQVERLKAQIFRAYLFETKDFRESIYGDGQKPVEPTPEPTVQPEKSPGPTIQPEKSPEPTPELSAAPTATPSEPSISPTLKPELKPSVSPTVKPTVKPSATPTGKPAVHPPAAVPTSAPENMATAVPTGSASVVTADEDELLQSGHSDSISDKKTFKSKPLIAKVSSTGKSQIIRWNSVRSADGYYIYGAKSNGRYKRLRTVTKKTFRWKRTGLKKGTQYKYYVMAYKIVAGKRVAISQSLPVYSLTAGGKYGNPVKMRTKQSLVSVRLGRTVRLKVRVTGKKMKKAGKRVRYISANSSIVKVSKKGIVTGVRQGTCYVYCVARNGLSRKIKVRVK